MNKTIQQILDEGKRCGFPAVEAFGEKIEQEQFEHFLEEPTITRTHNVQLQQASARAFWKTGPPVGFRLSKPDVSTIRKSFANLYSINWPSERANFADRLPASVRKTNTGIYDTNFDGVDEKRFTELLDQVTETMISAPFKGLQLKRIQLSRILKKTYIANTKGLQLKYIKTVFKCLMGFGLGENRLELAESSTFFDRLEPFKVVSRAYNLLNSITDTRFSTESSTMPLLFAPEASAFILREFSQYFMIDTDRKLMDIPFPAILNIIDDPSLTGRVGSVPFDDEGVHSGEKYLIKKGVFSGLVSHLESAFHYGASQSTGNGFRSERSLFPAVRFTNLYIKPTVLSLKNLMDDAGEGLLVSLLKLKYIEKDSYVFSAYGYRFSRDGLMEPVHFYIRTGFLSYFLNIRKISKEIRFFHTSGNIGSPYLLMESKPKANHLFEI